MNELFKNWSDGWAASQQALMKSMFAPPAGGTDAGQAPLQEQFAELRDTWKSSIEKWTEFAGESAKNAGPLTPEALAQLFAPAQWSGPGAGAFDSALRQVLEGPKYATLWDHDRKLAELQQLALQRDKDIAAYQAIVQKAWNTTFQRFTASFASTQGEAPGTWRSLTDRWLAMANDTLIEVHRSDEFVEAQRRMLRSASDYRLQERKLAEAWCEASHIPTRTEVDELQRTVIELRRQLRALQREKSPPAEAVGADSPPAAPRNRSPRAPAAKRPRRSART
jgi:hypothetical protein